MAKPLNPSGIVDVELVRGLAESLGLDPPNWEAFLEQAQKLTIGDGAPPIA